ncbi:hypothetical protein NDU88_007121 [Pleurodeles waltl]|uniref:Uncharacterized protein n=1 Tax=Pleurodeles waltl TaxID=8319 RepID=A0AAV7MJA1_PLEWA|nr:hypothetical protein NDU88_007121 [Pleurodeles waltl]
MSRQVAVTGSTQRALSSVHYRAPLAEDQAVSFTFVSPFIAQTELRSSHGERSLGSQCLLSLLSSGCSEFRDGPSRPVLSHMLCLALPPPPLVHLASSMRPRGTLIFLAALRRSLSARSARAQAPLGASISRPIRYFRFGFVARGTGPRTWPCGVLSAGMGDAHRYLLRLWPRGTARRAFQAVACVAEPHNPMRGFSGGSGLQLWCCLHSGVRIGEGF